MKFRKAVELSPSLEQAWQTGLSALRSTDRTHVRVEDTRRLTGSVDLDNTLKSTLPNEPRWDYAVGYRHTTPKGEIIYWVEVHPATDGEIKVVLKKLAWLKQWLCETAPQLNSLGREFIWVSSGKTSLTLSSPQQKKLAEHGLQHRGRVFQIPKESPAG